MTHPGRPRALDETKRREICALLSAGCGIERAAHYVSCAPSTIRREAMRNADFHERMRRAELAAQVEPLQAVRKAATKNWRAAAWLLERTQPERFAIHDTNLYKPEEVETLFDCFIERIANTIADRETRERIYHALQAELRGRLAESRAAQKPLPDPERARRLLSPAVESLHDQAKFSHFSPNANGDTSR